MAENRDYVQEQIEAAQQTDFASRDAERSVLGAFLSRYDKCKQYMPELRDDDFYWESHRIIFQAIKQALADGLSVDLLTVDQMIGRLPPEQANGMPELLIQCVKEAGSYVMIESYLAIVKELAQRRRALALVAGIQSELNDPANAINGIMDRLRTSAGDMMVGKHSWVSMESVLIKTFGHLEDRVRGGEPSIATGIPNVDAIIGGFFGGELTVIGARPAVGKSVFGMDVSMAAARAGFRVGICSREMADIQFGQRILSYESYVDGMKIRKAQIEDEDWDRLSEAVITASRLPIEFLFSVRTVEDLRSEVQQKFNRGEIDMLVVDYLQLMETAQRFKEDRLRVGNISKALKAIARDFNIPVLALAQVKRYAGGARAKMPTLEDLKDSGNIEQDADNVIFLHNPYDADDEYVDPRDKESFGIFAERGFTYLCIGVAKQRQGATGKACVLLNKRDMHYYTIDRTNREAPPQ